MSNWNIVKKLFAGTGALVALLLIAGGVAYWGIAEMDRHVETATKRTTPIIDLALRIQKNTVSLRGDQRRVLLAAYAKDSSVVTETAKHIDDTLTLNTKRIGEIRQLLTTERGKQI